MELMTQSEIARIMKVGNGTVSYWLDTGKLAHVGVPVKSGNPNGSRMARKVTAEQFEAFLIGYGLQRGVKPSRRVLGKLRRTGKVPNPGLAEKRPGLLTRVEAAEVAGVHQRTVDQWVKDGLVATRAFPVRKPIGLSKVAIRFVILRASLEAFVAKCPAHSDPVSQLAMARA